MNASVEFFEPLSEPSKAFSRLVYTLRFPWRRAEPCYWLSIPWTLVCWLKIQEWYSFQVPLESLPLRYSRAQPPPWVAQILSFDFNSSSKARNHPFIAERFHADLFADGSFRNGTPPRPSIFRFPWSIQILFVIYSTSSKVRTILLLLICSVENLFDLGKNTPSGPKSLDPYSASQGCSNICGCSSHLLEGKPPLVTANLFHGDMCSIYSRIVPSHIQSMLNRFPEALRRLFWCIPLPRSMSTGL